MTRLLVHTSPLVAILSRADQHHETCLMALRHLPGPLFSCWPVITEAAWLLRGHPRALQQLLGSLDGGFLELLSLSGSEGTAIAEVIRGMRTFALNSRTPRWFTWLNAKASTPSLRWISAIFRFTARGAGVPSAFCLNCRFAGFAQEVPSFARLDRWNTCPYVVRGNSGHPPTLPPAGAILL
jgi:hypothetical protein